MTDTRFAHLTDLHLPIPAAPSARELMSKRLFGYLSWRRNRRFRHQVQALARLADDCRRQHCDANIITGDAVNISLSSEFAEARKWLIEQFDSERTLFTPGNHDAYVGLRWADSVGQFAPFMRGERFDDPRERAPADGADFPYTRRFGAVCFVLLNSAVPTALGLASGRLGPTQLGRLRRELEGAGQAGLCRVVALHHPAEAGVVSHRKGLIDAQALRAVLAESGVELVIHGHAHSPTWGRLDTAAGPRPSVGGGSASHASAFGGFRAARYNIFSVSRAGGEAWRIDVMVRELDPDAGTVETVEERRLL